MLVLETLYLVVTSNMVVGCVGGVVLFP